MSDPAVNILITRSVRPGREAAFEEAVGAWIPIAMRFPGHRGVVMLRPGPGSLGYATLLRFRSGADWERFRAWPDYQAFVESLRPMLAAEPSTQPLHGMESWFIPTDGGGPARWKMAALTWIGVTAAVWVMSNAVRLALPDWPGWAKFLLVNTLVVAALTWMVMPLITRAARPWLDGANR